MGRGGSPRAQEGAASRRRISPTKRGFEALKSDPRLEGWRQTNGTPRYDWKEQAVWTAEKGYTADHPLPTALRTKRNVTLSIDQETNVLSVWMDIQHPHGVLSERIECGTDPKLATETFASCAQKLQTEYSDIGSMPEEVHLVDQEWLEDLIVSRFRNLARSKVRREVEDRKRAVEKEARVDQDELARELMAEAGFDPGLFS